MGNQIVVGGLGSAGGMIFFRRDVQSRVRRGDVRGLNAGDLFGQKAVHEHILPQAQYDDIPDHDAYQFPLETSGHEGRVPRIVDGNGICGRDKPQCILNTKQSRTKLREQVRRAVLWADYPIDNMNNHRKTHLIFTVDTPKA